MNTFQIITDGVNFKVQKRFLFIFWETIQEPEDLDNKYFGGDKIFKTKDDAKNFIDINTPKKWNKTKD